MARRPSTATIIASVLTVPFFIAGIIGAILFYGGEEFAGIFFIYSLLLLFFISPVLFNIIWSLANLISKKRQNMFLTSRDKQRTIIAFITALFILYFLYFVSR